MTDITIAPIKTDNVDVAITESNIVLKEIQSIDVKDQLSYERVASIRKVVNSKIKELDAERKEITVPLDTAKKKIMELFNKPLAICKQVLTACDVMMIAYTDLQERKRKEEQDRLDRIAEAARKKKEEEERVWREKEDAKRKEAEKLAAEGKEEEARKAQAEADKATAKADKKQDQAAEVIAPVAAARVEKPQGVSYVERWSGEVVDESILPREYMVPDQSKINKVISATKGTLPIPGVKIIKTRTVSSRG